MANEKMETDSQETRTNHAVVAVAQQHPGKKGNGKWSKRGKKKEWNEFLLHRIVQEKRLVGYRGYQQAREKTYNTVASLLNKFCKGENSLSIKILQ